MHFDCLSRLFARRPAAGAAAALAAFMLGALPMSGSVSAEPLVALARPALPEALRQARPMGHLAAANINVALALPWRDASGLATLLQRQADPHDPLYKRFLTHQQFLDRFAPAQADYDAVQAWAAANGLSVSQTTPSRNLVFASGTSAAVEAAFGVRLNRFQLDNGRVVYANDSAPKLPQSIAARVASVVGLTDYPQRRPFFHHRAGSGVSLGAMRPLISPAPLAPAGTGPGGGLTPADIRSLYSIGSLSTAGLDGTGQTVALYEQNGYDPTDIAAYAASFGLPDPTAGTTPTLQNITIRGYNGVVSDPNTQGEVTLDIEMVLAVAPKAKILVYEYDDTTQGGDAGLELLAKIANDDLASVVSESYGLIEDDANLGGELGTENLIFQQMAAQGQSMFASSGDSGAFFNVGTDAAPSYVQGVSDPASQPYVVGVGGTSLKTDPIVNGVATYGTETTWNFDGLPQDGGGGGGISKFWSIPAYQQKAVAGANFAATVSATMRNVPDVSLNADPNTGYAVYLAKSFTIIGGTSASSPLWAAFTLLVNQQRATYSLGNLGFPNPQLYAIGTGVNYGIDFHDIADGSTNMVFAAEPGYDDATGLGTYIANALLPDLAPTTFGASSITVKAVDINGKPVSGATITVTASQLATLSATQTTQANGSAVFPVPTGIHNFNNTGVDQALTFTVSADLAGFAGDSAGGVAPPATVTLTLRPADHTYTSGSFQMIAAPYDYSTIGDFATLFGLTPPLNSNSVVSAFYAWSPNLTGYLAYPTAPADTLRIGHGYWAYLPANAYVRRHGVPAPTTKPFRINLLPGWNMIGDPFTASVSIQNIKVDTINPGTPVAIGASTTVQMPLYTYNGSAYQTLSGGDSLQPFVGYWIHATSAAALVIPVPK